MNKNLKKAINLGICSLIIGGSTSVFAAEKSSIENNITSKVPAESNVTLKAKASYSYDVMLGLTEPGYIEVWLDHQRASTFSTKDTYVGYGRITSGDPVYALQFSLNSWSDDHNKGYRLTQDGEFGSSTRKALIDFQKWDGISQDGVCGPSTWNALVRELNKR